MNTAQTQENNCVYVSSVKRKEDIGNVKVGERLRIYIIEPEPDSNVSGFTTVGYYVGHTEYHLVLSTADCTEEEEVFNFAWSKIFGFEQD